MCGGRCCLRRTVIMPLTCANFGEECKARLAALRRETLFNVQSSLLPCSVWSLSWKLCVRTTRMPHRRTGVHYYGDAHGDACVPSPSRGTALLQRQIFFLLISRIRWLACIFVCFVLLVQFLHYFLVSVPSLTKNRDSSRRDNSMGAGHKSFIRISLFPHVLLPS